MKCYRPAVSYTHLGGPKFEKFHNFLRWFGQFKHFFSSYGTKEMSIF